ncbi:MAG: hypothetical protein ACTHU0_21505 [Kofleriaceae bacterium]
MRYLTYTMRDGRQEHLRLDDDQADFLERARALSDPTELARAIYGRTNPLLAEAGREDEAPRVTEAVYDHPLFRALLDLLARAQATAGGPGPSPRRCTMPVELAAARLGMTAPQVAALVHEGRIVADWGTGELLCDPNSVEAYRGARAARAALADTAEAAPCVDGLRVRHGSRPGLSFRVRYPGELAGANRHDTWTEGVIPRWQEVAVLVTEKKPGTTDTRLFILRPGLTANQVRVGRFFVEGRFDVATTERNPQTAREVFQRFMAR